MTEFYTKVKEYLREAGYSLEAISSELGMTRSVLSAKFSGARKALTHPELKIIIKALARLEAINTRAQALELLELAHCPKFTEAEWESAPLNKLEKSSEFAPAKPPQAPPPPVQVILPPAEEAEVLVEVKLYRPQLRAKLVSRSHLSERLNSILEYRLALIVAPAGFGKTTLTTAWLSHSNINSAWVSLDQDDHPGRFWRYLLASLNKFCPDLDFDYFYRKDLSWEQFLPVVINQISAKVKEDFVLVLDDYHVLNAEAVTKGMSYLLDHLPPLMHVVIISRSVPLLPLARYRVRNQLIEITATDLRFTSAEAAHFLNEVMGLQLSEDSIRLLEARTEGWAAGLQLAALSLLHTHKNSRLTELLNKNSEFVSTYLFEEVLALQPQEVQTFLLETAILGELNADLCQVVTGRPNSQAMLERLEHNNLFISRLGEDNQWYRYHNLFADFLVSQAKQTLEPAYLSELHKSASIWYEQHNHIVEAVNHAILVDDQWAALLLERVTPSLIAGGRDHSVTEFVNKLSPKILSQRAKLCIYYSLVLMEALDYDAGRIYLQQAEQVIGFQINLAQPTLQPDLAGLSVEQQEIAGELFAVYTFMTGLMADLDKSRQFKQLADQFLPPTHWLHFMQLIGLGMAYYLNGQLDKAKVAWEEGRELSMVAKATSSYSATSFYIATILFRQGKLHEALTHYNKLIAVDNSTSVSLQGVLDGNYMNLATLFYEWNDLAKSISYLKDASIFMLNIQMQIEYHIWLSRNKQAQGFIQQASEHWDTVHLLLKDNSLPRITKNALAQHALFHLQQNNLPAAFSWQENAGLNIVDKDTELYKQYVEYLVSAAILMAEKDYKSADFLLDRLVNLAQASGFLGRQIQATVLQAISLYQQQQKTKAFATIIKAIELAEPEGYIRSFLDRGFSIEPLLSELLDSAVWKRRQGKLSVSQQLASQEYVNKLWQAASTNNTTSDKETSLIA